MEKSMLSLIATLLCLNSEPANDVDYIHEIRGYVEINVFVSNINDIKNTFTLKQVLIKKWIPQLDGHHVVHWFLIDRDYEPFVSRLPNGKHKIIIRNQKVQRFIIICDSIRYTTTQYDPEVLDREKLPSEKRRFHFRYRECNHIQRFKPIILLGEPAFN